jgi:iron complex outermembrane receptor protein
MHKSVSATIASILLLTSSLSVAQQAPVSALEEIVVTATKRETTLKDTPIAISVLSEKGLEDRHVSSLLDLSDGSVPGLTVATFEARQSALTIGIRGIVPLDANQPAREQGVGVYVDGVYLGRQHGLNSSLLDLERIEVLKGPQGTLFGRNTEGGAVSMVTKKPTGMFGINTSMSTATYGSYDLDAHVNLPSVSDISTKVDFITQHRDSIVQNPLADQRGWAYYDRKGVKIAVRYQPVNAVTVDYSYDWGDDHNTPFYSQLLNYNPTGLVVGNASGQIKPLPAMVVVNGTSRMDVADVGVPQQDSTDKTTGHTLSASLKFGDQELRSITASRSVDAIQWDNSGGAHRVPVNVPNGIFSRYSIADLYQTQFSQEFQLVGSLTDSLNYVGGVYYFTEDVRDDAATPSTNKWDATMSSYTINDLTNTLPGYRSIDRESHATAKSYAGFGQVVYSPIKPVHVTLGGRYTSDDKAGELTKVSNIATTFTFAQKTSRFNPLVIVAYDVNKNINTYVKYATGYRSGGASSRSITYRAFGPEDNKSYEFGVKSEFQNVRLNLAAYTMDRTGSQIDFSNVQYDPVTKSTRNTLETINAPGITKIKGIEVEGQVSVTDHLKVSAAYTYTDTNIPPTMNPFKNAIQPVFVVFTPKNVYNAGVDYSVSNISVHIDANYQDATQTFDQFDTKNDSSFIVNAKLGYKISDEYNLSLWSRNLLDETHVYRRDPSNATTLGYYGNFNAPRIVGMTFSAKL